jgi:hypothetical protein
MSIVVTAGQRGDSPQSEAVLFSGTNWSATGPGGTPQDAME